jgi:hypothetical protein
MDEASVHDRSRSRAQTARYRRILARGTRRLVLDDADVPTESRARLGYPPDVYDGLRTAALAVTQATVGRTPPDHPDVLGVVVDIPRQGGIASIVAMADGTTSMYTSTGGGTIGAGSHRSVAAATHALLATRAFRRPPSGATSRAP